jgi:hypothetical protein
MYVSRRDGVALEQGFKIAEASPSECFDRLHKSPNEAIFGLHLTRSSRCRHPCRFASSCYSVQVGASEPEYHPDANLV